MASDFVTESHLVGRFLTVLGFLVLLFLSNARAAFPVVASDAEIQALRAAKQKRAGDGLSTDLSQVVRPEHSPRRSNLSILARPTLHQAFAVAVTQAAVRAMAAERQSPTWGDEPRRNGCRQEFRFTRDGVGVRHVRAFEGGGVVERCELVVPGLPTWTVHNGAWTGPTVALRDLRKALAALTELGVRVDSARVEAPSAEDAHNAERILCRLGLKQGSIVGGHTGHGPSVLLRLGRARDEDCRKRWWSWLPGIGTA